MHAAVSSSARVFKPRENEVVSQVIDDEAIIINMNTGCYYSLNKTGAEIWDCIGQVSTVAEIVGMLQCRYDCEATDVTDQVEKLLVELEAEQLIEQLEEERPQKLSRSVDQPVSREDEQGTLAPFETPRFEKHSDMREFLLVDPIHQVDDRGWPHKDSD